jgi:hypothetical protein
VTPLARILVEGADDKNVLSHLLKHHGLNPEIKDKDGFSQLLRSLRVELRASDITNLAIVVDADSSLASRWQSLRDTLLNCGYQSIPLVPSLEGTVVVEPDMLVLGLWIMPNNRLDGILEHFVAQLIPEHDQLWPKAQADVGAIPVRDCCFKLQDRPKAEISTWLAWQQEPGVKMGAAIHRRYLMPDSPAARSFAAWMRRFMETATPE